MIFVLNSNYKQLDSNLLDFIFDNCCYIAGNCCWPPPSQLADRRKQSVENIPTFNVFQLYLSVVNHVIFTLCILVHPCARLVLSQCRIFASSTISKMGAQQMEVMRGDWVNCRFWLCSTQAWAARDFMSTTATSSLMRAYLLRLLMRVCEEVLTLLTAKY